MVSISQVAIIIIVFIASFIQGITSFGFSLIALPFLTFLLPLDTIVPMLVLYSLAMNIMMLTKLYRHLDLKLIMGLVVGGVLGIPFGVWLLAHISPVLLKKIAGIVILIVATVQLSGKRVVFKRPSTLYFPVGLIAGVLQGSLSLSGPPVVVFLSNQEVDKEVFRGNLTVFFAVLNLVSLPGFILSGSLTQESFLRALAISPALAIGIGLGMYCGSRMGQILFRRLTLGLMLLAGLMATFG